MSRTRCAHGLSLCWQNALRSNSTGKPGSSRSMSSLLAKAARRWKGNRQLRGLHIGRSQFVGQGATVDMLSTALANQLGRPVMDRTGLAGNFNFKLNWTPPDAITPNSPDPLSTPDQSGPSIFTAVREQLGLELKATKGSTEALIIDHVERPTAN